MKQPNLTFSILAAAAITVPAVWTTLPSTPASLAAVPLSDQVGVYGLIDKVESETSKNGAKSVRIFGAFAIAHSRHGNYYRSPKWGFLAYHIDEENADKCRTQWKDLKTMAGTGKVVGFGFRYRQRDVAVWQESDRNVKSVMFHTGMGVRKARSAKYAPIDQLLYLPKPHSPVKGDDVICKGGDRPEQPIEFTCDNCTAKGDDVRYIFEVEQANGDIRGSAPIPAGDQRTTWKTTLAMTPGQKVTWRVRVIASKLKVASVATASFVPSAPKKTGR
jgi:hypothetical protein